MKRRTKRKALHQDLNVTNLVDVTFAILVVFMITAPLMTKGVQVNLPKASAPSIVEKNLLKISLTKENMLYIGEEEVKPLAFKSLFSQTWDGKSAVLVNSDSEVLYGKVMQLVGEIQSLGVTKVGFLTSGKPLQVHE